MLWYAEQVKRGKYAIKSADRHFASRYLSARLRKGEEWGSWYPTDDFDTNEAARRAFQSARDEEDLTRWGEKYLDLGQWQQLKSAIRQRRRRAKYPDVRNVTLTKQAHWILSAIAERDGVTLSQVIEEYLADEWTKAIREFDDER